MFEKVIVVKQKTRLENLIERYNSRSQAKFYLEHSGCDFETYQLEHDVYHKSLEQVCNQIEIGIKTQLMDRSYLPSATITKQDMIVTVGQDGLVANTAKYVGDQPIISINPDPVRIDGILCTQSPQDTQKLLYKTIDQQASIKKVTLAQVALNDGQTLLAFNDFFIGVQSHVSARYKIKFNETEECQSSSGILISTGAGSTGWLSSVFNMNNAISQFNGGTPGEAVKLNWDEQRLIFVVREPFQSRHSGIKLSLGFIEPGKPLIIESQNPLNGTIFSDGIEKDYLEFNSGKTATISIANQQAHLVVD